MVLIRALPQIRALTQIRSQHPQAKGLPAGWRGACSLSSPVGFCGLWDERGCLGSSFNVFHSAAVGFMVSA